MSDNYFDVIAPVQMDVVAMLNAALVNFPLFRARRFPVFDPEGNSLSRFADSGTARLNFHYQLFNRGILGDLNQLRFHAFARMHMQFDCWHIYFSLPPASLPASNHFTRAAPDVNRENAIF